MLIPRDPLERSQWLAETRQRLRASVDARTARYGAWRNWFLYGAGAWGARYNKIGTAVGTLASYLYAPRSARFSWSPSRSSTNAVADLALPASDRLRELWSLSGADAVYADLVQWSLVYGATIGKFGWSTRPTCVPIMPSDFGVWRDDLPGLEGQQALLQKYRLDVEAATEWLLAAGVPARVLEGWRRAWGEGRPADGADGGAVVVGQMTPIVWNGAPPSGAVGAVTDWGGVDADYSAQKDSRTIGFEEIWVRDDATHDFRVFTVVDGDIVVSDRENPLVPKQCPFVQLAVAPLPDYFWGQSQVSALIPLQAWREKRMNQLDRMFARQAMPPAVMSGFAGGMSDEKYSAAMRRGGILANTITPQAKIELLTPSVNELSFAEIQQIDAMFDETLGLTASLQGQAVSGVRGGAQAKEVMSAGMGRLTRRMLAVEQAVANGAAYLFKLARRFDASVLQDDAGRPFTLGMLPAGGDVEVQAHSASPLFSERAQERALDLLRLGLASKEIALDIADPPMAQAMKRYVRAEEAGQKKLLSEIVAGTPAKDRGSLLEKLTGLFKK